MIIRRILIFISCISEVIPYQMHAQQKYKTYSNSLHAPQRLLEIMATYTEEARQRNIELNEMRFMYEESPQYEQGYIMGEIVERFRKVVEHTKRPLEFKSDNFFNTLKRTQIIQVLYFEVYHLVRMMHEIPKKYAKDLEHGSGKMLTQKELYLAQKNVEDMKRRREQEKRRRRRLNAKLREAYMRGLSQSKYGHKPAPYNQWWPIDYGWEIDYYW